MAAFLKDGQRVGRQAISPLCSRFAAKNKIVLLISLKEELRMKKIILLSTITILCLVTIAFGKGKADYTIESDAQIFGAVKGRMDIVDALVKFVKAHGNTCDSVSAASDNMFSRGFTLKCNGFRYEYQILDKGGKWYLQVEN